MNDPITFCYRSPLGTIRIAAQNGALFEARFVSEPACPEPPSDPALNAAVLWLDTYFSGRDPGAIPPCLPNGTPFQMRVWEALRSVLYGETVSYAQLARRSGFDARYARAVAAAVGKNPIAIFLPCHRVIGKNGSLTGYAYGLDRKTALLRLERGRLSPSRDTALFLGSGSLSYLFST